MSNRFQIIKYGNYMHSISDPQFDFKIMTDFKALGNLCLVLSRIGL